MVYFKYLIEFSKYNKIYPFFLKKMTLLLEYQPPNIENRLK